MIKKILIIVFCLILTLSVFGCTRANNNDTNTNDQVDNVTTSANEPSYGIFTLSGTDDVYFSDSNPITFSTATFKNSSAAATREFTFDNKVKTVKYSYSQKMMYVGTEVDVYMNETDNVLSQELVMYKAGTDEIVRIVTKREGLSITGKSESELKKLAEDLLKAHIGVNVEVMEYLCSTFYSQSTDAGSHSVTENGFVLPTDKISVSAYTFYFGESIGGFKTMRNYAVTLYGGLLAGDVMIEACDIEFDEEDIAKIKNVNEINIKASVSQYIQKNLKSGYIIKNIEYGDLVFFTNNGDLYAKFVGKTTLKDVPTGITREFIVKIG